MVDKRSQEKKTKEVIEYDGNYMGLDCNIRNNNWRYAHIFLYLQLCCQKGVGKKTIFQ